MSKGGQQTTTQQLDPASQRFVEQFLRPLAMSGVGVALGQPGPSGGGGGQGFGPGRLPFGLGGGRFGAAKPGFFDQQGAGGEPFALDPSKIPQFFPGATPEFLQGVEGLRNLGFPSEFFDPFEQQVIGGLQSDFDRQRGLAAQQAGQFATGQGAFGGSRQAVLQSLGQRDIGDIEARTLAQVRSQGLQQARQAQLAQASGLLGAGTQLRDINVQQAQNPLFALQQALGFAGSGLGQFGSQTTTPFQSNPLGGALGGAATGFGAFGLPGGIAGGLIGLLGL